MQDASTGVVVPALLRHLPEYLIEALCLGLFIISAGLFTTLFEARGSWLHWAIASGDLRRALTGMAMGLTCMALVYSPWGRRSGAHMNPAVTLAFWHLGRVRTMDALGYIAAQFIGGLLGVLIVQRLLGESFSEEPVFWVITVPGAHGALIALIAEFAISFIMMWTVLRLNSSRRYATLSGIGAGTLVALFITVEGPLSGMSMNPARSFASAAAAHHWQFLWIYFVAPCLGMLTAAQWHQVRQVAGGCAKLMHDTRKRCIHCGQSPASVAQGAQPATMPIMP